VYVKINFDISTSYIGIHFFLEEDEDELGKFVEEDSNEDWKFAFEKLSQQMSEQVYNLKPICSFMHEYSTDL
jgi:hypothetical protein